MAEKKLLGSIELNRIYQIDCLEGVKLIPDNSIDLIIADPPYTNVVNAEWDRTNPFTEELVREFYRVCKDSASIYVWCGIGEKSQSLLDFIPKLNTKFYFKDVITWKKQRGLGTRKGWLYTREELLWYVKDNKKFKWIQEFQYSDEKRGKNSYGYKLTNGKRADEYIKSEYKRLANVWTDISEATFNTSKNNLASKHLTPKPEKAAERLVKVHTHPGDIVLVPFCGSGTECVAASRLNRNFISFEIEREYIEIANKRLEAVHSEEAAE